jgi:uncharacterized protein (DUF983 family)
VRAVVLGLTLVISGSTRVEYVSIGGLEPVTEGALRWVPFSESPTVGLSERPWAQEVETMPTVTCPSCGERGKIGASFIGSRLKCKKCGLSFLVSAPAAKQTAGPVVAVPTSEVVTAGGIEVEGLDASSWSLSTEVGAALKAEATVEPDQPAEPGSAFIPTEPSHGSRREYKLLTSRDKFFEGKFDLPRLEEALNHFGKQGWTVKTMSTPHLKGFSGALEETIVVLLER